MLAGLLASLGFAGGVLIDKFELSKRHIKLSLYLPLLFLFLCALTGILLLVLPIELFPAEALESTYLWAFLLMLALAFGWNVFYYRALAKETVQEFDLLLLTEPLVTIVLASVFFSGERHPIVLILALIAAICLIFTHMHRRKVRFDTYARGLMLSILLMSLEVLVIRVLLEVYHPISLYFIRTLLIFLGYALAYKPQFSSMKLRDVGGIFLTALFGVLQMVSRFFGYRDGGVVITTLILLLGPLIVEIISLSILKEKLNYKSGLAFAVIFLCVLYASIVAGS